MQNLGRTPLWADDFKSTKFLGASRPLLRNYIRIYCYTYLNWDLPNVMPTFLQGVLFTNIFHRLIIALYGKSRAGLGFKLNPSNIYHKHYHKELKVGVNRVLSYSRPSVQNILHTLVSGSEGMRSVKFWKYALLRLNLEANLITVTEYHEVVNAVLIIWTETKDSALTSDH